MSKIVKFQKKSERNLAAEALRVLEDAYAYYTPAEDVSAEAAILAVETPLEQLFGYYSAA